MKKGYKILLPFNRGVAQFGSALGSGPRGRWFKSSHSDQSKRESVFAFSFSILRNACTPAAFGQNQAHS